MRIDVKGSSESRVREYLLGRLPDPQKEALEQDYLADPKSLEQVEIAEDELIDDYLDGSLSPNERLSFQRVFLTTEARSEKLRLARAIRKRVTRKMGFLERVSGRLHVSTEALTRVGQVGIAALVLLSCGLGWLAMHQMRQARTLRAEQKGWLEKAHEFEARLEEAEAAAEAADAAAAEAADAGRSDADAEKNELRENLRKAEETVSRLQAQVRQLENKTTPPPAAAREASVRLRGDAARSGEVPPVNLPGTALLLELQLELPARAAAHQSFQAQLLFVDRGNQIVQNSLLRRRSGENNLLRFPVGSGLLQPGNYSVQLGGFTRAGVLEELDQYRVRVTR